MTGERVQRRLAAIVSVDVVGYSRLMEQDETGTLARLKTLRAELLHPKVAEYGGRIVKTTGDGTLVEFGSAVDALSHAVALQHAMAERHAQVPGDQQIQLRLGINVGDIIIEGDDIFGDGVNIASRIESLAEPGGICISGRVYEYVKGRLDVAFEDLGEQTVKNITEPLHVYRVRLEGLPARSSDAESLSAKHSKPSIAVLPFDNLSNDPEQEFFADGMTEDIITELSRYPDVFVIARNSTFTYKNRAFTVQDVCRELGAHYVVEGSVRKSGNRLRVTVQLIDGWTGSHLWAERYDRDLVDVFEVQDELTQAIVATLPGRLWPAEVNRLRRKPPQDLAAFDYMLAGRIHHHRVTRSDNAEALRLLDRAIELDPDFAEAYAWKAGTLGQALACSFAEDPAAVEKRAIEALEKALALDENSVECHRLLCEVNMEGRQLDQAAIHNDLALSLNPNDPRIVAQKGELLTWLGNPGEGVEWIRKSCRLDPFGVPVRSHLLGRALYGCGAYAEAVTAYQQKSPPRYGNLADMAACHAQIGDEDAAAESVRAVLALKPGFTISSYVARLPYRHSADRDHLVDGLRKAGLPDS
ncbi:MAG: adenylate/guanylate cyclase domain-containing protein [bacterium]